MENTKLKRTYEDLFDQFLETTDFRLIKYGEDEWGLEDLSGANLGNIEQDRFRVAMHLIDRMDIYIESYYICDIQDLLEEAGHNDIEYDNWAELIEKARPLLGKEYQGELDILDAIFSHAEEIDLNKCYFKNN